MLKISYTDASMLRPKRKALFFVDLTRYIFISFYLVFCKLDSNLCIPIYVVNHTRTLLAANKRAFNL